MPAGSYGLKVQGFQRPGSYNQVYSDYIAGTNNVKVTMEMTMEQRSFASQKVKNIMDDRQPSEVVSGDVTVGDGTHIPNSMASARAYFDKGYYDNCMTGYTPYTGGLRIYFKGDNSAASSWTICDNFRLYYYGGLPLEDIEENINAIEFNKSHSKPLTTKMFNVLGQQVSGTAKGLVIINGKKYLKR